jgi:hypothetical protein
MHDDYPTTMLDEGHFMNPAVENYECALAKVD